ncbi:MAG: hypothetical protein PHU04_00800 [Candidatus Peribacteraceae bacterium]|nr:hypothetical protein [Candidatus Peribacteraceae bacterium]
MDQSASNPPIRAIAGRFSFRFSKQALSRVFKHRPFEYCALISKGKEPDFFAEIPLENQEWFDSGEVRGCKYAGVDWNALAPLDATLIERMRECECMFMDVIARLEWKRSIPYATRKRWYLQHLRFWNDYLSRHRINLYLSAWMPHELPDLIIYYLCKARSIPVLYFDASAVRDTSFAEHDIKQSSIQIRQRYEELAAEYADVTDPKDIPLSDRFEQRYQALTAPMGEEPPLENVWNTTYFDHVRKLLIEKPLFFCKCALQYVTPRGIARARSTWRRKRIIEERNAFYEAHAVTPDLSKPFVYMTLHYQPEASTIPMAGAYREQLLIAQTLNACLPDGVIIYVKEHPRNSGWLQRSIAYYEDFLALEKVRFVPRSFDTFTLREHCMAVATATGTIGFEALFRGKPTLMFGHRFYQYAPGVYQIHSMDDCRRAVHDIFVEKKAPTLKEARLFMKAMDDTCIHGTLNIWHLKVSHLSDEEHMQANAEAMLHELSLLAPAIAAV